MKKTGLIAMLLFAFSAFIGCKKQDNQSPNNNQSGYYFRFKADGKKTEYTTTAATMEMGDALPNHTGYFIGYTESGTKKNNFAFRLFDTEDIKANKTYTEAAYNASKVPAAYGIWYNADGTCLLSFKTTADPIQPFKVTLTEVTSTSVKGNFSGKVKEQNGSNIVEITEGEFYLKRID